MRSTGPVAADSQGPRNSRPATGVAVGAPALPATRVVLERDRPEEVRRPRPGSAASGRRGIRPPSVKVEKRSPGRVAGPGLSARPSARPLSSWESEQGVLINHTIPQSTRFAPISPMCRERRYNPASANKNISDFSGSILTSHNNGTSYVAAINPRIPSTGRPQCGRNPETASVPPTSTGTHTGSKL